MFTGIVEATGRLESLTSEGDNLHLRISCPFTDELQIDQSVAHNGVCLTVVEISEDGYVVTAIRETMQKTNLGDLKPGSEVNLERCMRLGDRLDGHIVQGHVDQVATVTSISEEDGSWRVSFEYEPGKAEAEGYLTVEKGSVCVNGTSLTVIDSSSGKFSVALIPYTWEYTNFHALQVGDRVNLEFDVIGKYVARLVAR